jgi:YbgC/YbaW family acyl-CoA thioester hydrolase
MKKFVYQKKVYLKDVNPFGSVYFSKFFEWQGDAREEFYSQFSPLKISDNLLIATLSASVNFKKEARLFDTILIEVWIKRMTKATIELNFLYKKEKTGEIIATGKQKVAFVNNAGKVIPIPTEIREVGKKFMED